MSKSPTPGPRAFSPSPAPLTRRRFLQAGSASAAALATVPVTLSARSVAVGPRTAETVVAELYQSLSDRQRSAICFDWDHQDKKNGLLRAHISNNWRITSQAITSDFYDKSQRAMIRKIFEGMVNPDWVERFDKQFKDDMGGFGKKQGIAIFGRPGGEKFEFVLTGRHGTMRCDGNTAEHVVFGGPIMYGHAARGYYEKANHPQNVFWHQAQAANRVYQMLDGKQQKQALHKAAPDEGRIGFRGTAKGFDGIAVTDLGADQKAHVQKVLQLLIEPYRKSDRDEAVAALKTQGGLDACHLAFYQEDDLGGDGVWDNWRLEGPAFVWHYRGAPHVHVWVNVADDPSVKLNSKNRSGPLRRKA